MFDGPPPMVEASKSATGNERLRHAIERDTSSVQPADQFELFRAWHSGIAEVSPFQAEAPSFPAHQTVWNLGVLTFTHVTAPDTPYGWRHLSKPMTDNWCLHLPLPKSLPRGEHPEVGDLGFRSFTDPFECVSERTDHLALCIPRNFHFLQSSRMDVHGTSKQFLTDYLLLLRRSLPDLRSADAPHIAAATTSLLAACLTPSRDHIAEAQRPIEASIMDRASRTVAQHLANPKLAPDWLCGALGVSRSRLYRIFEPLGGVSSYIRRERLRKTRDALVDSSDGRSISTIAEQWGFTDPSAFSRMFKKEFGISPGEARAGGSLSVEYARPAGEAQTLLDLLLDNA